MENVRELMEKDGRRQVYTGIICLGVSLALITGFLLAGPASFFQFLYLLLFAIGLFFAGISLTTVGRKDVAKAKHPTLTLVDDDPSLLEKVPSKMYFGFQHHAFYKLSLMDYSGQSFLEVEEQQRKAERFITNLVWFVQTYNNRSSSLHAYSPDGALQFTTEKKGGFRWGGYVLRNNHYIGYVRAKNLKGGKRQFTYINKGARWTAEGDYYIGHYEVKDGQGHTWITLKKGAVPTGADEKVQKMGGAVLEWHRNEALPTSLLAFLSLIMTRE